MDETTINTSEQQTTTPTATTGAAQSADVEHRQAYGTAKTENLRDNGAYRVILPGFVALLCLAIVAIPLIILVPLFVNSLDPSAHTNSIGWLFLVIAVVDLAVAALVIRGFVKTFMTQAGNY